MFLSVVNILIYTEIFLGHTAIPKVVMEVFIKNLGLIPNVTSSAAFLMLSSGLRELLVFLTMQWILLKLQDPAGFVPESGISFSVLLKTKS